MPIQSPSVRSIFERTLEFATDTDRQAYLDEICAGQPDLRDKVQALLQAHADAGSFLDGPAMGAQQTHPFDPIAEQPGTLIGPYKLLEQIGEGGFGVVFMAEQERPVRRTVALKVIKPGMDTRQVIARFEAERQALAMMDHPNIAKVHDAGATESGRPYFVMELVKGVPITRYCDEKHLPLCARLELFVEVCQAVQHAHQKGIIHRDIKPTNVLVAEYDNRAVPKVIDFGVAKATAQKLTERTMFTEFGQVLGTIEYMSPEQAKLNQFDIDTRSDIYSLGVLLYELLTGSTPIEGKRLHEAAFDEMLRIIREEEPPKPSTRLSATDQLPSIAANRGSEPKKLSGFVKGELDWVAMKALDKDRNHRYQTANGLSRDIERYLGDEPVQACPPSAVYRFRKFARRNKVALFAASAALATLLLLLLGLALSNRLIAAERNQKSAALADREKALAIAKAESERADDDFHRASIAIREVLTKAAMGSGEWSMLPPQLRKQFTEEAVKFYKSTLQGDSSDPNRRYEAAVGHRAIGTLHRTANEPQDAEEAFRRSTDILEPLVKRYPAVQKYRHQLGWSYVNLSRTLHRARRTEEATTVLQNAAKLYEKLLSEEPTSISYQNALSTCYADLSAQRADLREFKQAETILNRGIALVENSSVQRADMAAYDEHIARMYLSLGRLRASDRRYDEARAALRKAAKHFESAFTATPTAERLWGWSVCYVDMIEKAGVGLEITEAEQYFRQFLEARSQTPDNLKAHRGLRAQEGHFRRIWAFRLWGSGRLEQAESVFNDAAPIFESLAVDDTTGEFLHFTADTHARIANLMVLSDRMEEAEEKFRRSIELHEQRVAKFPKYVESERERAASYLDFATLLARIGRLDEAAKHHQKGFDILEELANAEPNASAFNQLAWDLAASPVQQFRDPARAVELAKKAIELAPQDGNIWNTLGVAQYRAGNWSDAITALKKFRELRTNGGEWSNPFFLAMAHWQLGNKDEARSWRDKGVEWMEKNGAKSETMRRIRAEMEELMKEESDVKNRESATTPN